MALVTKFAGAEMRQTLTLHKGANYISLTQYSAIWLVSAELQQMGKCRTALAQTVFCGQQLAR